MIKRLASDSRFNKLIKIKNTATRGNLEELVLKFFAYFEDRKSFTHSVRDFLNTYMEKKTKDPSNLKSLENLFSKVMAILDRELPYGIVRGNRKNTTPLVLYEAVAVGIADLVIKNDPVDGQKLRDVLDDPKLNKLTTGATNSQKRLIERISYVSDYVR